MLWPNGMWRPYKWHVPAHEHDGIKKVRAIAIRRKTPTKGDGARTNWHNWLSIIYRHYDLSLLKIANKLSYPGLQKWCRTSEVMEVKYELSQLRIYQWISWPHVGRQYSIHCRADNIQIHIKHGFNHESLLLPSSCSKTSPSSTRDQAKSRSVHNSSYLTLRLSSVVRITSP